MGLCCRGLVRIASPRLLFQRHRRLALRNGPAWVMALLFAALSIGSNLRFLPRMHIPIAYAFMPPGFHLVAALLLGITAGFCEEVLFRAFLMTEFANAGYGKVMQVLMPGLCVWAGTRWLSKSGSSSLARHHASHRVSRYDVGNCVPPWTPQLVPCSGRPLLERRNGASLDRILYGNGFVGPQLARMPNVV